MLICLLVSYSAERKDSKYLLQYNIILWKWFFTNTANIILYYDSKHLICVVGFYINQSPCAYCLLACLFEWVGVEFLQEGLLCHTIMSFKSFFRELWEIKDGLAIKPKRGGEGRNWRSRTRSHIAPDEVLPQPEAVQQGQWANLPPELLLDIIRRVEESETSWPARTAVLFCASVCKSWRNITKEVVKTPEQCGRLTFPISLKQVKGLTFIDLFW